jgi:1-aminocyclopropane-1-carboxylate deaminase/D-cysteine desulfhydrase-like pyridoxal-dependent ACC family enzyme
MKLRKIKQLQFEFDFKPVEKLRTLTKQGAAEVYSKASDKMSKRYVEKWWGRGW